MSGASTKTISCTEKKIVSISSKRQITIPQKYFIMLGFEDEAECLVRGNELVIRPARTAFGGDFAEMILADLIEKGLSGNELLARFKEMQSKVGTALAGMRLDASKAANDSAEYATYEDVFGTEE